MKTRHLDPIRYSRLPGRCLAAILVLTCLGAGLLGVSPGSEAAGRDDANWPQFRGTGARGISNNPRVPDRWSATENVAWKVSIPGRGWSSPIVWGDRVFLTTVVNLGETEPPKKGLYFGGERPAPVTEHHWKVLCLDLKSGRVRWERTVQAGKPAGAIHLKNSYASETPVTDGQRVYALFGGLGLYCFNLDGKPLWSRKLTARRMRLGWGTAASPVLHGERIYLVDDNEEQSSLLALDRRTGDEVWRVERDEKSNWATPYVWENGQRTEIVTPGSGKVRAYGLDGKLLWWLKGMSDITIATPYAADGLLWVTSGYVGSRLRPIYAIRPGATGDISLKEDERSNQHIAWCDWRAGPYNPSTLVQDGRLFVLYDRGLFGCYDARTGTPRYERQRTPEGAAYTASPWAVGGKIFCLSEDGVTSVFRAGDRFEPLHTNSLAPDDMCMATPAISGDRLLIRTAARLYCILDKSSSR